MNIDDIKAFRAGYRVGFTGSGPTTEVYGHLLNEHWYEGRKLGKEDAEGLHDVESAITEISWKDSDGNKMAIKKGEYGDYVELCVGTTLDETDAEELPKALAKAKELGWFGE